MLAVKPARGQQYAFQYFGVEQGLTNLTVRNYRSLADLSLRIEPINYSGFAGLAPKQVCSRKLLGSFSLNSMQTAGGHNCRLSVAMLTQPEKFWSLCTSELRKASDIRYVSGGG